MSRNIKEEQKRKPKHMYEKDDWDRISIFHSFHSKATGISLTDSLLKFYVSIFFISIILAIFTK